MRKDIHHVKFCFGSRLPKVHIQLSTTDAAAGGGSSLVLLSELVIVTRQIYELQCYCSSFKLIHCKCFLSFHFESITL